MAKLTACYRCGAAIAGQFAPPRQRLDVARAHARAKLEALPAFELASGHE